MARTRVAILYPTDPAASIPSGIDSFIRGIIKYSPPDLEHTLFGASADLASRPLGKEARVVLGGREVRYVPIVAVDAMAVRSRIPLTLRYLWSLRSQIRRGTLDAFDILDCHRIEPLSLFRNDPRPKNLVVHQDMSVLRDKNSDIMWRHAPWLYEAVERRLMETTHTVLTVRQSAVERYAQRYPAIAAKFRFIPTWVDSSIFSPNESAQSRAAARTRLAQQTGAPVEGEYLVFVGRLDRQKDPLLLLDAFERAVRARPALHLMVVGDGSMRAEVEAAIAARGLQSKVSLLGVLPAPGICEVLRASDLFVLSSAYEGMPIAVLEALATGVPVVSTDVGEVKSIVESGRNGYVIGERTAETFAGAILQAMEGIATLRGEPCTRAASPYHPAAVLGQLYDLHRSEAAARRAA